MPRIRTIKPDAFLSESLSSVPRGTRWTFAGLWTYADDKGRARDDARLVKAALYPLDDDVSLDDVRHDLDLLAGIGAICRYAVGERNYLHMPKWGHQKINRPTPAKSPPCPVHEGGGSGHVVDTDDSLSDHGGLTEPSTWEGKGREMDREGEREGDASVAGASCPIPTHPDPPSGGDEDLIVDAEIVPDAPSAQDLVAEWIDHCEARPPKAVIGQIAKHVKAMLGEGIEFERVRHGLAEWNRKGVHPSVLPSVVHEVSNKAARPSSRNAEWTAMQERQMARALEREKEMGLR